MGSAKGSTCLHHGFHPTRCDILILVSCSPPTTLVSDPLTLFRMTCRDQVCITNGTRTQRRCCLRGVTVLGSRQRSVLYLSLSMWHGLIPKASKGSTVWRDAVWKVDHGGSWLLPLQERTRVQPLHVRQGIECVCVASGGPWASTRRNGTRAVWLWRKCDTCGGTQVKDTQMTRYLGRQVGREEAGRCTVGVCVQNPAAPD
jgi:hypothetical protein